MKADAVLTSKPLASLSLDLDNLWTYLKTHGEAEWENFPSYLEIVVPRFLSILERLDLKTTVFVVGQDAALPGNEAVLKSIVQAGHEIGNHSFHHEPWLHLYSEQELEEELVRSEAAITAVAGKRPRGFRGPGFSCSDALLHQLAERGYNFDASSFPTFLGPLARAYYFFTSRLSSAERRKRKFLFGTWRDGLRPLRPFKLSFPMRQIWEIPVTTMPLLRIPIHLSYVLYIGLYSPALALRYFRCALRLCRLFDVNPSLLLHPLDFISLEEAPALHFFPAMRMPLEQKLSIVGKVLDCFAGNFRVLPMGSFCATLGSQSK